MSVGTTRSLGFEDVPFYNRLMTKAEAEHLRREGIDPDDILISEAQIRQGKWMSGEDFFAQLRKEQTIPHIQELTDPTPDYTRNEEGDLEPITLSPEETEQFLSDQGYGWPLPVTLTRERTDGRL